MALLLLTAAAYPQIQAGGAKAGLGRVFDGAGRSAAAKELQQKMNGNLLRTAVARSKAAKAKSGPNRTPGDSSTAKRPSATPAAPAASSYTDFRPAQDSDFADRFAMALSSDAGERASIKQIVTSVKSGFEKEVEKRGRPNNLAAAFTFFVASTVTVYHDDPEPDDRTIDELWDGINDTLNGLPEISRLTDREKQEMYEMLIACGGLVLAGHVYSSETGDANAAAVYRQLAGELIRTVLQTDPETLRFGENGLKIAG